MEKLTDMAGAEPAGLRPAVQQSDREGADHGHPTILILVNEAPFQTNLSVAITVLGLHPLGGVEGSRRYDDVSVHIRSNAIVEIEGWRQTGSVPANMCTSGKRVELIVVISNRFGIIGSERGASICCTRYQRGTHQHYCAGAAYEFDQVDHRLPHAEY